MKRTVLSLRQVTSGRSFSRKAARSSERAGEDDDIYICIHLFIDIYINIYGCLFVLCRLLTFIHYLLIFSSRLTSVAKGFGALWGPKYRGDSICRLLREKLESLKLHHMLTNVVIPTFDIKTLHTTIFSSFEVCPLLQLWFVAFIILCSSCFSLSRMEITACLGQILACTYSHDTTHCRHKKITYHPPTNPSTDLCTFRSIFLFIHVSTITYTFSRTHASLYFTRCWY